MFIRIDIDGTIAGRNLPAFVQACTTQFGLHFAPEQKITYASLMAHPTMFAYQRASPDDFQRAIVQIEQAPEMIRILPTLPRASEGVQALARVGDIGYLTVRKAQPPRVPEAVQDATVEWLRGNSFPAAHQVTFCMSLMNKLLQLYFLLKKEPEYCVFIDDLAPQILEAFLELKAGHHPKFTKEACVTIADTLQRYVTLVAFGQPSYIAINSDLRMISLPSWEDVDDLIQVLPVPERRGRS